MAHPPAIDHKTLELPPLVTFPAVPSTQAQIASAGSAIHPSATDPSVAENQTPQIGPSSEDWQTRVHGLPQWDGVSAPIAHPPSLPWQSRSSGVLIITEPESAPADEALFDGFTLFTATPSWLVSMLVHLLLVLLTAILVLPAPSRPKFLTLELGTDEGPSHAIDDLDDLELEVVSMDELRSESLVIDDDIQMVDDAPLMELDLAPPQPVISDLAMAIQLNPAEAIPSALAADGAPSDTSSFPTGAFAPGGLGLRTTSARKRNAIANGATRKSEEAVERALRWLVRNQRPDGGWDFGAGRANTMVVNGRNGATGLALLAFLGAGHTHKEGKHRYAVQRGIEYLKQRMKRAGNGIKATARLTDSYGNYYSHGLCTIALCEAYAMSRDEKLRIPAQQLINEIVDAQDPRGGGWRYTRRASGDTSVLGWQLMALKSGQMAYLAVPQKAFDGAAEYLDSVQMDYGSAYGYLSPGSRASTSAVGLLSRMYLGWGRDHQGIEMGAARMGKLGPDPNDIYFSYYATQVLHHYGGPKWETWNVVMRDGLVNRQQRGGANDGSWQFRSPHNSTPIYCTCMATMILEVYYRHMPLYGEDAAQSQPR